MKVDINDIAQVIIDWDWEEVIIPNKHLKKLEYVIDKKDNYFIYCKEIIIEIDLSYVKANDFLTKFEDNNIWGIRIKDKNGIDISLLVPSYRKECYMNRSKYPVPQDASNLCEKHYINDETYKIEWKENKKEDIYMTDEEMKRFFKESNLSLVSNENSLAIELFDKILNDNIGENSIIDRIEELSNKNNKPIIEFIDYKNNLYKIMCRIHNVNYKTKSIYKIRKGYTITEQHELINDLDIFTINAKNHSYKWNFNFIFIPEINNKEQEKSVYETIYAVEPNEDTKKYFSRNILVFNDNIDIEEFMLEFYEETYPDKDRICIENETLLFTTYKEINEIWYNKHKEWNLL